MSGLNGLAIYQGFAWAVPEAFAAAIHACRFEQGDVLYSDVSAYDDSKRSKHPARFHIQVVDPPRTTRALTIDGEGQRFFSNWESAVRFEWMDYRRGQRTELQTTQGRLFTCLWKGDEGSLLRDDEGKLERPLLLRELQTRVADCMGAVKTALAEMATPEKTSRKRRSARWLFATAIDQSSDTSRVKSDVVVNALGARFDVATRFFSPRALALDDADRFHPTLEVLAVVVESDAANAVEDALRDVLYAGGNAGGKDAGRFQLARHGCLVECD